MRKWINKTANDLAFIGTFCVMMGLLREFVTNEPIISAREMWQSGLVLLVSSAIALLFTSIKEK